MAKSFDLGYEKIHNRMEVLLVKVDIEEDIFLHLKSNVIVLGPDYKIVVGNIQVLLVILKVVND